MEIYLVLTSLRCVLNSMMGRNQRQHNIQCPDSVCFATELNQFYVRFNNSDEKCTPTGRPVFLPLIIEVNTVEKVLLRVKPQKTIGPDGKKGKVQQS